MVLYPILFAHPALTLPLINYSTNLLCGSAYVGIDLQFWQNTTKFHTLSFFCTPSHSMSAFHMISSSFQRTFGLGLARHRWFWKKANVTGQRVLLMTWRAVKNRVNGLTEVNFGCMHRSGRLLPIFLLKIMLDLFWQTVIFALKCFCITIILHLKHGT